MTDAFQTIRVIGDYVANIVKTKHVSGREYVYRAIPVQGVEKAEKYGVVYVDTNKEAVESVTGLLSA